MARKHKPEIHTHEVTHRPAVGRQGFADAPFLVFEGFARERDLERLEGALRKLAFLFCELHDLAPIRLSRAVESRRRKRTLGGRAAMTHRLAVCCELDRKVVPSLRDLDFGKTSTDTCFGFLRAL